MLFFSGTVPVLFLQVRSYILDAGSARRTIRQKTGPALGIVVLQYE